MAEPIRRFRVTLTVQQIEALSVGLSEYVYLIEEGTIAEAMAEHDMPNGVEPLSATEAAALRDRLDGLVANRT